MPDDREMIATTIEQLDKERRTVCGQIGSRKARGEAVDDLLEQSRVLSAQIAELRSRQQAAVEESPSDAGQWSTEVLTSAQQVGALRDEWRELLSRCSAGSPFLTWEWMMSWYETYEDEGAVRCLAVRDAKGSLAGIAPLFLSERRDSKLGRRQIGFASTCGSYWGKYLQLIHTPQMGEAVAQATTEYLGSIRDEWDCAKFLHVPVESNSAWFLIGPMVAVGWHVGLGAIERGAVVPLPTDDQDVVAVFPSYNLRKRCRQGLRRLQDSHPRHAFRFYAPEDGLDELLEKHMLLNVQRRSQLGVSSNFQSSRHRLCFTRTAKRFAETARLRLALLEIEGEVVATLFCLLSGGTLHLWSSGWAPQWADHDVSHLVFVEALRGGMREGAREASFVGGGYRYKDEYGSAHHLLMDISVWQNRRQMVRSTCGELWRSGLERAKVRVRQIQR
jgi:CelD/BcsL family acetyltransferase involved in cellulose biosynthesis